MNIDNRKFRLAIFCIAILIPSTAIADGKDWISGYGSVALTNDQTLSQCKAAAFQAAKANIFSKAGLEKFSSEQFEICSDTEEATHCELPPTDVKLLRRCLYQEYTQ